MKKADSLVGKSMSDYVAAKKFNMTLHFTLAATALVLAISLATKSTEVVVMPPTYSDTVVIEGNRANEHYMLQHAMGIASMVGNINERNVNFVVKTLLDMLSPFLRSSLEDGLNKEVQILKLRKASQQFVIEDMMYEPKNNLVWVWGTKTLTVKSGSKQEERWTYEFRIEPRNGAPKITHFDNYPGTPKQKNNDEYTVDNSPYLNAALDKVMNDPRSQNNTRSIESDKPADKQTKE